MQNGYYKASDTNVGTSDWISLNFTSLPQCLLHAVGRDGYLTPYEDYEPILSAEEVEEPDEPEREEFESQEEFDKAYAEYEKEEDAYACYREGVEDASEFPMWGTMWVAEEGTVNELLECGFSLYSPLDGPLAEAYDGCVIFGVNGAGYGFFGAHWLPFRALLLSKNYSQGYLSAEDFKESLDALQQEAKRDGGEHCLQKYFDMLPKE